MKKILLLGFLLPAMAFSQQYDVLIVNGKIIDGAGNSWFYGDVAVKNGKIAAIGKLKNSTAAKTIDASGLIICRGPFKNTIFNMGMYIYKTRCDN